MNKKVSEVIKWYVNSEIFKDLAPTTQARDHSICSKMDKYFKSKLCQGNMLTHDNHPKRLTREGVRRYIKYLQNRENMSNATIIKYIGMADRMIRRARRELDWDLPNPFSGMTEGMSTEPRLRFITEDEQRRLIIALKEPYRGIFRFMLETGLRLGECLELTWDRVDFSERLVWFRPEHHKSGRLKRGGPDAASVLTNKATAILKARHKIRIGLHVFQIKGEPIKMDRWRWNFNNAQEHAGIREDWQYGEKGRRIRAHDARRTFALESRESGIPIEAVSAQLRHQDIRVTQKVYAPATHNIAKKYYDG